MSLTVSNVSKVFSTPHGDVTALDHINFTIKDGEFVSIVGKSGSGKTTLLTLLGALDTPTTGSIEVGAHDVAHLNSREQVAYRARHIGFVFQQYNLIPNLTAIENVCLALEFAGVPKSQRMPRAEELLDAVGLEPEEQGRTPLRLSGGQQQRVSIARALANQPAVILADEPTGNLDSETGAHIFDLLHNLSKTQQTTVIVVTHDLDIAGKTDRIITIKDGKIVTK